MPFQWIVEERKKGKVFQSGKEKAFLVLAAFEIPKCRSVNFRSGRSSMLSPLTLSLLIDIETSFGRLFKLRGYIMA